MEPQHPSPGIPERMNLAVFHSIHRSYVYKGYHKPGTCERDAHFGFDFEMGRGEAQEEECGEVGEAKPALGVGQGAAGESGEVAAHPSVGGATDERHGLRSMEPVAHDQEPV